MLEHYSLKLPKEVYSGADAMQNLTQIMAAYGTTKVGLFTDAMLRKLGLIDEAVSVIEAAGLPYEVIDDAPVEPPYEAVQKLADRFNSMNCDLILAIGGGSVMDAAKLCSVQATDAYTVKDLLDDPTQAKKQVKTVMVPTTAGTGSEATPNAIVAVPEKDTKIGIVNNALIADAVILDVKMIQNLPPKVASGPGVDTLCHAIECFTSTKANPFSDTFALDALQLTMDNLEKSCLEKGNLEAKRAMQLASFYGGIAITAAGTTAVHALSYPLGGKYHVPHGVSNAILLIPVMKFNKPAIAERLAIAYDRCLHGDAQTVDAKADAMIARMEEIVRNLNIPTKVADLGVTDPDIDFLVEAGMQQQRLLVNNMREVTPEDARALYEQII